MRGLRLVHVVVGPSAVGDWGVGAVAEFGLFGAGGEGGGDVVPGGAVVAGFEDVLGEHALGLVDEAGQQGEAASGSPSHALRRSASW